MRVTWLISTLALFLIAPHLFASDSRYRAGAARVNITPDHLMWMSGYRTRDRPADGKLHDLWAKALIVQSGEADRFVLITADLVGVDRRFSTDVCSRLAKQYGLRRQQIAICVSHTHSGPVVGDCLAPQRRLDDEQQRLVDQYATTLKTKLVGVVGQAINNFAPCRLSWENGRCEFAVNRRENPESKVPQLREAGLLKGPVDHDVPVLKVADSEGTIRAIVFGYACHATVTRLYQWSGDYPGFAQQHLEKEHSGAIAMFWAGCGADQNPLPRREVALAQHYGKQLANSVQTVLQRDMPLIQGEFAASYRELPLPMQKLPTVDALRQASQSTDASTANWGRVVLERMQRKGGLHPEYPYPVQIWRLGNGPRFVLLGGEVVVDYALRLKSELGPKTWIAGYANDVMNYVPSRRVWTEGGYEGARSLLVYGRPAKWSPDIERLIVTEVLRQAKELDASDQNAQ